MTKWEADSFLWQLDSYLSEFLFAVATNSDKAVDYYRNRILTEVARAINKTESASRKENGRTV